MLAFAGVFMIVRPSVAYSMKLEFAGNPEIWAEDTQLLNVPFSAVNTLILVLSSVTCQLGVFAAERGQVGRTGSVFAFWKKRNWGLREWFILTYFMGSSCSWSPTL